MQLKKIFSWAAVFLWMGLIFFLSHQPATASAELSGEITGFVVDIIRTLAPGINIDMGFLEYGIRKSAHFLAFFVLGILTIHALGRSGVQGGKAVFTALAICGLYAVTDEIHQLFIPGRSGEVTDVLLDTTGAGMGIAMFLLIRRFLRVKGDGSF